MTKPTVGSEIGAATVVGLLRARAAERPEQVAFTFLADGESEGGRLTYAELDRKAAAIAAALAPSVPRGERALLLYPPGLDFIAAFFGCLYAGVVAVPAYPPRPNDRSQSRLRAIAHDATPRAALTTEAILAGAVEPRGLLAVAPELAGLRWIPTDTPSAAGQAAVLAEPAPESLAFLQYTSGSTAAPKGVMVSHRNLLHNERMIGAAFGMDEESVVVGWLPLYHDMGLIGNVLQPLHAGGRCVLMSPVAFLQRPMRWLEAISRYRGTVSGGPNFAYELCVRKASPEALAGLDLSSWRVAYNGAEPVRASTLERFAETFAPCGFRPEAFYPCYGLAEATLFVTGGVPGRAPRVESTGQRVSCGQVWMGQRLVVADPETGTELPGGEEGEVWLSGPSVAGGYWENPEGTARDFNAFLATGEGPFLRTGDLGYLAAGELYVTGRLKDLIILRGRNHYPQDVELTAERAHPDLHPGGGAAFAVETGGEERLVIVHEVARHRSAGTEAIAEAVRSAVAAEHEVQAQEVVLIRQGGLPKTSSGKVQRRLCRDLYLRGELPVVGRSALAAADPAPEIAAELTRESLAAQAPAERRAMLAAYLRERAAAALGVPASAVSSRPLTALGLDSLTAIELKGGVEAALGIPVPLSDLLGGIGVADLAEILLAGLDALDAAPARDETPLRSLALAGDQPLSPGQRGLWFLHRLAPEGGAYNIAVAARTQGLDTVAFARALAGLAVRHEALRTLFPVVADEPVQRVLPELAPDVQSEEVEAGLVPARLAAEAWRPFSLERGPLLRARVFRTGSEETILLVVHHIVADFASLAVMARDLSALYRGEVLAPPVLRYADYVHWQAGMLAGPRGKRLWSHWRERLAGVRDLDLPADHPRPAVQTWRGGARAASLPPALVAALGALAAGQGATLFMTLLAAFQAQLARYTGQEDFAVGSALSGRPLPELGGLVGYFVNSLPLRAELAGEPGFGELLGRVRSAALAGMEHGDLPFPLIAERLRPVRDPARSPIFQTMLVLQRERPGDEPGLAAFSLGEEGARLELGGLTLESVRLPERRAQLDLTLFAAGDGRGGLGISLEHNADLFDAGTAERMLSHFQTLLEGAVAAPETPVWHLPLLSASERGQLFQTWSGPERDAAPFPRGLLLHQLFEAQAARTPEAVAVVAGEVQLTYAELNARANRLAHRLRRLGVGPEERVGICLRRSERMIVGLLAVLKAGGAYVPMDPNYPRERLALILEDSRARVVLGEEATAPRLAEESGDRWLSLEAGLTGEREENPAPAGAPGNLAYLIYTSGSTGRPKAVAVEHRSPVVLMHWAREVFPPEDFAGALAATSIGFDVSVFELFAPLSWGGRLLVVENLLALPGLPAAGEARLICGAPSAVAELVRIGRFPSWARTINLGGEAVPPALVEALAAAAPEARILNVYGPSEDTVYTTFARLEPGEPVTIGVPVANTRIYLRDTRGEPVPAGVPGELCIAGEGLARGYLDRPELTAEKFVPDPFAVAPGGRLYRTGDLARRRADGVVLEYLGRLDHQVKIRGFRVELGEIEAALARHPRLREAVVVAREDGDRGQRLVAYVVPAGVPAAELRGFLRESLPEHMVPAAFVGLDTLPLSPNGKVDRRALPATAAPEGTMAAAPFRTPVEEMLAGLAAEVLGVESVGADDDFFALGGHSLLATRLLARVSRLFGVDLPVSSVFLHPTVGALAERIAAASGGAAVAPVRPVPRSPEGALPLSFAQRGLWLLDRLAPGSPAYHLPGAVRLSGPLDLAALEAALAGVVGRHEALRTVFRVVGGEPSQVPTAPAPTIALPRVDLTALAAEAAGAEADRLAHEVAVAPFDLARGPLWRAVALRISPQDHLLAITLHHIVADGWSLEILVAELAALYAASAAGLPAPPLPALPVQYADWAVWQRAWFGHDRPRGAGIAAEVDWWRERLAGSTPLELPADRPLTALRSGRGGTRAAALPAAASADLERLARREGATPFMVLLAAFQAQLARYTGAPTVAVGSPVANRGRAEVEGLIGVFVNMLVLRTPVAGDPDFRELLGRVREVCLGAYAHQDLPFERLVEELRPERQGGRSPLFQVVFRLEQPIGIDRLGGAAAEVRRLETGTAKFDLTLGVVRERAGFAAVLEYDADLFDPATADRMLGHWRTLAQGIAAGPEARLSDLPLLAPAEAAQLHAWSGAVTEYPRQATIHGLFAEQAARAPEAVALSTPGERISYADLDARSSRLASRLNRLGADLETRIGLCVERSPALIAGMLGILKAGGVYVPLDPAYPAERLEWMVADAGLDLLVVESSLADSLALPYGIFEILVGADGELEDRDAEDDMPPPAVPVGPENLAYVMYTSGSTGQPKGVEVTHRGVVRLVRGADYARFGPDEVFLQLAPAAFDAATFEIWGALLNGARLALLPGRAPVLDELGPAVAREGVTTLWLTAGLFHSLVESRPEILRGVSQLLSGGDVLSAPHVRRALSALPGLTLIDGYGPTENTTFTACHPMRDADAVADPVPIGRPIANTTVHLLDGDLRPVLAGVPGELYTGGDGLARGYRGRPELTAERFVPDPFPRGPEGGARLYRTGDLARWQPDGALEFLGRRDQQVKIRGFRVEPGEIEAALLRLPGVAAAAVVAREEAGGKALAAYVVPRAGEALPGDLGERLRALLPEHMLPSHLIALPELPLNANGKVDRRELAAWNPLEAADAESFTPPRTLLEERLAAIWREVLRHPRVGVHDDFFALGGHSLLAVRVLTQIHDLLGVEVSMTDLFEAPTVAGLAERLAIGHQEAAAVAELPLESPDLRHASRRSGRPAELPRTPLEEQLAAIWREVLDVDSVGPDDDFFALGGHSLLAYRVTMRIAEETGVDLGLHTLFEFPTVAALAGQVAAELASGAPERREEELPVQAERSCPLSFAQQRLWLLDRIEPGSPKYNVPIAVRLTGSLETGPLVRALAEIVRRHEPLRTVYAWMDGEPVQVVLPPEPSGLAFARVDLTALPAPARDRALRQGLDAEAPRPFDLARGPVVRFLLLELGTDRRALMATFHHIATDGWSMAVFFRELAVLYADFAAGREPSLPELPVRYADWAVWQRQALSAGTLDAQLAYWRRQLAGVPVLELPADRPRSAATGDRGASRVVSFPADLAARLRGLGSGEGITAFTTLLAGFTAALARLSGQDDLAVGLTSAGRNRLHTEGLIGFFVNTLVARTRMADDPPFGALLLRVRDTLLVAQKHQDVPFERLVEELQPERVAGLSPLFQAAFTYLASPLSPVPMPGLAVELMDVEVGVSKFDLTLSVYESEGRLNSWVEYRTGLFDPATVERWMGHLRTLLEGAAADPSRRLSELPLLAAPERWQLTGEWNATDLPLPLERCLHELVEAQAARTPDAPAVVAEDGELTYRELDARAERLARRLRRAGVGPEVAVGLFAERSAAMVVGLLGVLKAGGAYVPLDSGYPAERLAGMLADTGAPVLLASEELAGRLPPHGARVLLLDRPDEEDEDSDAGAPPVTAANLACVIFTSGSTGRPKGVMLPHRGLVNRLLWAQSVYRLTAADAMLLKAAPGFDVAVWECFAPLIAGARLVVARPGGQQDAGYLARTITEREVTFVHFVPSMLEVFLRELGGEEAGECRSLRQVFAGGEALSPALRERFLARFPGVPLDNEYGPTETSIDVTRWVCAPGQDPRRVPLGRPIGNLGVHLLDRASRLVPIGVAGALHVRGAGLARGYFGRPELTAERFVPDPKGRGERLYDTGDLARRLPDGNLEFLGRADQQVKVRGFRIELGEVEAVLLRHPGLAAAAVGADAEGARLIAWVVPRPGGPAGDTAPVALRDFLRDRLPEAMIPSLFVPLDALPLTPTGKLDRRALPAPSKAAVTAAGLAGPAGDDDAPATPAEELLAGIWGGLLGIEEVGVHDDFFDLGGHSLLAIQAISRVREAFGVELAPAELFAAATPAGLARRLEQLGGDERSAAVPPPQPLPRDPEGEPLSFAQERLWFLQQLEPESSAYNVPGALRLRGPLRPELLARALEEIARRHEALRTVFQEDTREGAGGVPVQIILPPSAAPLPVVDLRARPYPDEEAGRLLASEARRPFDLATGPLARTLLLRTGDEEHLLAVVMHHVISDAWSLRILLRELAALYQAYAAGEPSPLPELPLQYADFARWQREQLAGERLEGELAHWRRVLAEAPETLDLPADRPRPAAPTFAAGRSPVDLPAALSADLRALARRQGWTPYMLLLAAFDALLARLTGQRDLVVGAPVANRNRLETEGLIGFFTNTLALRLDLAGDPSFRALARRARAATLEAYAHQDLPFERLVEDLAPRRERGRNPLFQVMLALNDVPSLALLELPGVAVEGVEIETGEAKFDLTLFLAERAGGFAGHLEFSRDLFDPATADRLLGHLLTLLTEAVAAPETRLSALPLLNPAEREQLAAWSQQPLPRSRPWTVHERIAEQAALHPEAEAVVAGDGESLNYGELLRRARRLAVHLRGLGVGPDVPVGIFLDRSPDLAVAILGALMAGGACLPLDPGYPRERLRLMLADAQAPVVITAPALAGALPEGASRMLLIGEALAASAGPEPGPAAAVDPDNLVYLIYTSGSTGRPKGVAMTHGAISAMLDWQLRTSRAGAGRTLQFAALSFDVSFQEIFSTWCAGGSLVLVAEDVRRDPPALLRLLAEQRVERLFLPFVALQQLALAARPGEIPTGLREVMSAGEQLYVTPQVAALFAALPGAALYNHYGPSETHAATWLALEGAPAGWPERPTVGRAVDHARIFLLDHGLRRVPVGVPGEVWVGGAILARGYVAQPELTAERFLPDPFDDVDGWEPGARLYRTGDLARWLPGGEIDYIGRGDHQVKIRGQRIELAEVETALAGHPALRQSAVAVRGAGAGSRRLVAYAVFREGVEPPGFAELRAFLAASLPDAMVPSAWMRLDSLPLTPSGKVDRRALPAPPAADEEVMADDPSRAPRDPAEELLAAVWSEVLGVQRVGIHDDFFELGGHSLLATQVMSRVREAFNVELPLRRLFEGPTVAELAHAIETALAAGAPAADGPIPRARRDGALPLSFAQERLWFLDRLQPGGTVYNLPLVLRLRGELDAAALATAFGEIVRRHEVLRTAFVERDGEPVQVVLPATPWELLAVDLAGLPAPAREREAARLAGEEAARPFDLAQDPLLRTILLRLGASEHGLLLDLHHIVSDGWSAGVLVREIGVLYAAAREGRPSPLPELPIQYADFALWQRRWLAGEALDRHVDYWRQRLRGLPAEIELPADRPRPAVPSHRGAEHRFALDGRATAALTALARREGTTPFMVLAASMLALLSRLSGRGDLAIGMPIANRNRAETEGLIGFFVNTLVLRADLAAAPGFLDLLRQVRETTLGAYAHQDLPFEKVIDELQPERDPARTPFFQVMFALQNTPLPAANLPGLTLAAEEPPSRNAKFDITFALVHAGDGLAAAIEYATDLFDPPTIARFAGQWRELLAAAVERPDAALASLPLLAAGQRHQVLQEWNDTARAWGDDPALHQLFERQADLRPEAPAGICQGETVSYGELEARANRLAHRLRSLGVGRGEPVGLWMERSLDLLAAVLGILKAGGLYVPLDAAWPAERVESILAGTGTRVLVAGPAVRPAAAGVVGAAGMAERLPALAHVVVPGEPGGTPFPATRREAAGGAEDPAYLIHTSGSTGAPKGIVVRHRSAVNTLRWNNETLAIGPGDRHLFVNSICFDLSIYDLLGMLGAGATVRVATEEELRDPERLARVLREEGITTWSSAPAALLQLVPFFPPAGEGRELRRVLLAGDWIPLSLPDRVRESFPGAQLANFGGATETSVWSNWYPIGAVDPAWAGIPYGRPIANTRYYILDAGLAPCPPGVPGDNYIGGDCPALGYAGQPALTAERFVPDPFSPRPGARMYVTGDRARFGPDGTMEFLGRVDFQVKVRGYRIELGEIEAALLRHPQVREAVALARQDVAGEKRLVAYVVPAGPAPAPGELREALQRTLPEYMVPWSFVILDRLPVTANGKLDRQALPSPQTAAALATAGDEAAYVAPRNELERAIAEVWREVLQLERVGVHDNFFESGGSSLLIVKLHGRLHEALGREIPVMELFRHTTIDALARKLSEAPPEGAAPAEEARTEQTRERARSRQDSLRQLREARAGRRGKTD
jgi:amino acid adenylation domain-containing protein